MQVGDLVRHIRWKEEVGIVVGEVDVGCPLWGAPREGDYDVFKVQLVTPPWSAQCHWRRCDVEVLSENR